MSKVISRLRRAAKTRIKAAGQEKPRLSVYKSNSNLYAQILEPRGSKVLVAASTNEKENKLDKSNVETAKVVGKLVAERALEAGIKSVVFDRSGYLYHGKIKAIAESAREAGLEYKYGSKLSCPTTRRT